MALLLMADGTSKRVVPKFPEEGFRLPELYLMLGCKLVEVCEAIRPGQILICDEEAKLDENHVKNVIATDLYLHNAHDYIAGNALLCDSKDFR